MDKALQKEKTRARVKRYRDKQKSVTDQGVTEHGTVGTTYTSYFKDGIEMVSGNLPERSRYLKLTDGQVLDRANQPKPDLTRLSAFTRQALYRWAVSKFTPLKVNKTRRLAIGKL